MGFQLPSSTGDRRISSINSRSPIFFLLLIEVTFSSLVKYLRMAQKNTVDFPIASPKMKGLMRIYPLERMADKGFSLGFSDQKVILVVIGILGWGWLDPRLLVQIHIFGGWKETHSPLTEEWNSTSNPFCPQVLHPFFESPDSESCLLKSVQNPTKWAAIHYEWSYNFNCGGERNHQLPIYS